MLCGEFVQMVVEHQDAECARPGGQISLMEPYQFGAKGPFWSIVFHKARRVRQPTRMPNPLDRKFRDVV